MLKVLGVVSYSFSLSDACADVPWAVGAANIIHWFLFIAWRRAALADDRVFAHLGAGTKGITGFASVFTLVLPWVAFHVVFGGVRVVAFACVRGLVVI